MEGEGKEMEKGRRENREKELTQISAPSFS